MKKNEEIALVVGGVILLIILIILTVWLVNRGKKGTGDKLPSKNGSLTGLLPPQEYPPTVLPPSQGYPSTKLEPNKIVPPGCKKCSENSKGGTIIYCPKGVMPASATREVPAGTEQLISNYQIPQYDPPHPDYMYEGQGFWFRQLAKGCP